MNNRVVHFSNDYLRRCRSATPQQIVEFLERYRLMQNYPEKLEVPLVPLKVLMPKDMLATFRAKCDVEGVKYQTQIKSLMKKWVETGTD